MSFHLTAGPPGSGKTTLLLQAAREACQAGRRVLWVGLPTQRAWVYHQAAAEGGLLGFEFISSQQLCYRLLGRALQLRPLRVGTERLALVAQALLEVRGELPAPGEARLFSAAIAELKRFGLTPEAVRAAEAAGELARLEAVFQAYERIKGTAWDYDDYRLGAVHLAEAGLARPDADLIIVDGYRQLLPLELRLYQALAGNCEVRLALPAAPEGLRADRQLPAGPPACTSVFRAGNEVAEARWIMRSIKADLAAGFEPLDLALVLPEGETSAYAALAGEYGVPLMDETPQTLAATRAGRLLLDLLEFPEFPAASGLLGLPGLEPLAAAAFERRLAGGRALLELARELDAAHEADDGSREPLRQEELLRNWLARLEVPEREHDWAAGLVAQVTGYALERKLATPAELDSFRDQALQRAREAVKLAPGTQFREWWAALLSEAWLPASPPAGVALLTPKLASGRNYRKAYLARAVEGSYGAFESEDYFVNEELRAATLRGLPRRYQGGDAGVRAELLGMAAELVITWPESSQGGPRRPDLNLTGEARSPALPPLPAGSPLELGDGLPFSPGFGLPASRVSLRKAFTEDLKYYGQCPFQYWAYGLVQPALELTWWQELRRDLRRQDRLSAERLAELAGLYPQAAGWLDEQAPLLQQLTFNVTLPAGGSGPRARVDAAGRRDGQPVLYRFAAPASLADARQASEQLRSRWTERWAAAYLLSFAGPGAPERVHLYVWPLLGEPVEGGRNGGLHAGAPFLEGVAAQVNAQFERFGAGVIEPRPDPFRCRSCLVSDFCRVGAR